jgi:glutamine amidotransferase
MMASIFNGQVQRFPDVAGLKVPHMGWNQVRQSDSEHPLWQGIEQNSRFYFVHSYYVVPEDQSLVAATCEYGLQFACSMNKENLFAVQFHPEKSHTAGLQFLKNFVEWRI